MITPLIRHSYLEVPVIKITEEKKIFVLNFFWMFCLFQSIWIPFYNSYEFTMAEILTLQAVFSSTILFFEVPFGYIADSIGYRTTLRVSAVIHSFAFIYLYFCSAFYHFIFFQFIYGAAVSLFSGTDIAYLYRNYEIKNLDYTKSNFLGKRLSYSQLGEGLSAIIGGFIASYSYEPVKEISILLGFIPLLICFYLKDKDHILNKKSILDYKNGFIRMLREGLIISEYIRFWSLLIGFTAFLVTLYAWSAPKLWTQNSISTTKIGFLWAICSVIVSILSRFSFQISRSLKNIQTALICTALITTMSWLILTIKSNFVFYVFFTTLYFSTRVITQVIFRKALNEKTKDFRGSYNSLSTFIGRFLFVLLGPLFGLLIDKIGAQNSFIYVAIISFIIFSIAFIKYKKLIRSES